MKFWTAERQGAVEIATFSNPPYNYLDKPVIDELAQLVERWREPSIRAVVIQSRPQDPGFFSQYSVEELSGLAGDPSLSRLAGAPKMTSSFIFLLPWWLVGRDSPRLDRS